MSKSPPKASSSTGSSRGGSGTRAAKTQVVETPRSGYLELAGEVEQALNKLRVALRVTIDRVLPVGYGARSLGRALGVERMTAWRCWTIAHVADTAQAIRAMPGPQAWRKLLNQLEVRGARTDDLSAVRKAIEAFDALLQDRGVDRTMLRSLADGALDSSRESASIKASRRAAMRAAARLYGLQAETFLVSHVLSPMPDSPGLMLGVTAITDRLRRLRPGMPWPIYWSSVVMDESDSLRRHVPLGDGESMPSVVRATSTPGIIGRELREGHEKGRGNSIELWDLRPELDQGIRVSLAENLSGVEIDQSQTLEPVSLHVAFLYPSTMAVLEVLVHRDLRRHTDPAAALLGTPLGVENMSEWHGRTRLPLETTPRQVAAGTLPKRLADMEHAYQDGIRRVIRQQGRRLKDFEAFRIELPYPPMFATASLAFELEIAGRSPDAAGTD